MLQRLTDYIVKVLTIYKEKMTSTNRGVTCLYVMQLYIICLKEMHKLLLTTDHKACNVNYVIGLLFYLHMTSIMFTDLNMGFSVYNESLLTIMPS